MFKSQEEFRMNSKKIISSVSLATAVLATGIISQEEAHADSVDNTTTTTASQAPVSYTHLTLPTICSV